MRLQSALDDLADAEEAQATGQEGGHRLLVGGVEGDRRGAAGAERGARQRQGGKPLRDGRLEGEPADCGEIEALDWRRPENGRVSCRERVCPHVELTVGDVDLQKKKYKLQI